MSAPPALIDPLDIQRLQRLRSAGSVTILLQCSGRADADRSALETSINEAHRRLSDEVPAADAELIVERLRSLLAQVDIPGAASLALFASVEHQSVVALDVEIATRVVVDDTFATRDLVLAAHRQPEYHLVTLGAKQTRRFEGRGQYLRESLGDGFPLAESDGSADQPSDRHTDLDPYARIVERTASRSLPDDGLPVFIAGTSRRVAAVASRTNFVRRRAVRVDHNLEWASLDEIRDVIAPLVDRLHAERESEAIAEAHAAVGQHRARVGIVAAWEAAVQGRVQRLVVERSYRVGARMHPDGQTFTRTEDVTAPGVVDDLVDELIELTLARSGGIVIVDDGALSDAERLVAVLRY